jgi:hypothetical protein
VSSIAADEKWLPRSGTVLSLWGVLVKRITPEQLNDLLRTYATGHASIRWPSQAKTYRKHLESAGDSTVPPYVSDSASIQPSQLMELAATFREIGLAVTAELFEELATQNAQSIAKLTFDRMFQDASRQITRELKTVHLMLVPREKVAFNANPLGGWEDVTKRFPSATLDIEEMAKCYAFGRCTASVFHAMRVMEHGLVALAKFLGVPYEHKNWDPIIKKMRAEIEDYKASSFKGNLDFIRQAFERLTAVQLALRNETMHARSFYDDERADDIYRASRAFMRQLATQLGEDAP